jgi:hypothetical protein
MEIATSCICCGGTRLPATSAVLMPFVANRVFGWEPVEITEEWGMRDLARGHAYPLCNTLRCETCGAVFLDMRFSDAELGRLYRNYRDETYTKTRERYEPDYRGRNELLVAGSTYLAIVEAFLLKHLPRPARLLDWGGDTGLNTPFAGALEVHHVYDISDKPTVGNAERIDAVATTDAYDLVVCSNVLEHVSWPAQTIASLASLLSDDSALYIEVPYEEVMRTGGPVVKRHWHEHVNFFTPDSLRELMQRSGLRVVDSIELVVNAGGKDAHAMGVLARRAR